MSGRLKEIVSSYWIIVSENVVLVERGGTYSYFVENWILKELRNFLKII
jgi:hypothetical protein